MLTVRQYEDSDYDVCRNRLWVQLAQRHQEIYGEVVGLTGLIVGDESTAIEPVSEIEPLVVDKEFRGQGIGGALIDFLKAYVPEHGLPELVVTPVARNNLMLEFMKKQGFDSLGTVELILRDSDRWVDGAEVSGVRFKV